ncbi:hypothetical protein ACROYT_G032757 [Oculina patagonica]
MLWGWLAWIIFVHGIHNTLSGEPPVIRDFLSYDLTLPGDVPSVSGFRLPCKASGSSPLRHRWEHNGRDIEYGKQYRLLKSGALEGKFLNHTNNGTYQCFVENGFGEDFSRKIQVLVSVAGNFYYANNKVAPVTLGKPVEIPCPSHSPSYGVTYRWGAFSSPADPSEFVPLIEGERIAVTLDGTLVVMFVTGQDVNKVNDVGGIQCEMSLGSEKKYSHTVNFSVHGNESTGFTAPTIYFAPKPQEEAREGYEKELYCLAVAKPEPYIIWRKDGEKIEDDDDGFYLPAEHFNRLLVIKKVTKEHQGNYTCTAYSSQSRSLKRVSVATYLTVKASPKWMVKLPPDTSATRSETMSLVCLATGVSRPQYRWFRNGRKIDVSDSGVKLQKNILQLTNVESWHEAVFQCVAENDQGMSVTSTWVHVEDPPTNGPSSQSGVDSQKLLWIIITAVLGVLLIVSVIILIICYKRRKARRREERPRPAEDASHYNDICDDLQSNPSLPTTAPSGVTGKNGMRRRATLPPVPQYQALDPSTAGVPSYEPLDPEQDLNDSGLYEKLDFRPLDNGPEYDNPDKPPEYLELVNDTNKPPGNTASTGKIGGPGKAFYEPMEGGLRDDVLNDSNTVPKDYVPMENEATNVKKTDKSSPSSPKYYEPMAENLKPGTETKGSPSSPDYYQPMAEKVGLSEQAEPSSPPPEYYVPMAEQSLSEPVVQASKTPPECSEDTEDNSCSSKL